MPANSRYKAPKKKVLVVDDEPQLCQLINDILDEHGFACAMAHDTEEGLKKLEIWGPDLILLDVRLPSIGGFEFCRLIRQQENTAHIPVIMLTAQNSETDKVIGFEIGADDYLTKPFSQKELIARIKALFRRARLTQIEGVNRVLNSEELFLDLDSHTVKINSRQIVLTPKEFTLLATLLQNKSKVVTRESLMSGVWGYSYAEAMGTLEVHMRHLRKKLGNFGKRIRTVVGLGYCLD